MKKLLVVLAVLAIGTVAASAQTFSFWNSAGTEQYCNFNVIDYNSGGVVAGYDDITTACGLAINSPIVGFNASVTNLGESASGKGVVVGDGIYDAEYEAFSGLQWTVFQSLAYSKTNKKTGRFSGKYGWEGVAGYYTGTYFGDNYGYLGSTAPAKNSVAGGKTTAGMSRNIVKR
ncbi:MAG: hypothetical protein WCB53_19865 [Terriglobales bacterium]